MGTNETSNLTFEVIKDTYIGVLKKYVVINGRARRREFWIFFFCNLVIGMVVGWIPVVNSIIGLALFIPNITVSVRRLHDTNRTGKWLFLGLVPVVPSIFLVVSIFSYSFAFFHSGVVVLLWVLAILVTLAVSIILLVWAAQEGTHGSNRYGPDPRDGEETVAAAPQAGIPANEKPIFCGECGAKNQRGTKFCGSCGAKL